MRVSRFAVAIALVTLFAGSARAQFTAVVAAPPTSKAKVAAAQQQQQVAARQDSVARVTLTNMKAWVDSAAGSVGTVAPMTRTDTAIVAATTQAPAAATTHTTAVAKGDVADSTFRQGGRAPNTASPLPMLALLGASSLIAGLALLRRRRA
jgi:hypothetical protein